ncbi:NYN domain-containing protein [Rubeoparvulum massiliense]|uniref:NYN domain-containing protein n=1 Tax=Rubeoparvulum massiliense TaxID=1631346 RepID=UPI00065E4C37|nr:NYN domain-containing protein [Rubeoparvulum massiliense]
MDQILLVDGYNIIGAWPELIQLKEKNLDDARDRLLEILSEYQAYTGAKVIVAFDAHQVSGLGSKERYASLTVAYTRENETADECIERLAGQLKTKRNQVVVATSDYTEQRVIFAQGALRKSARELLLEWQELKRQIKGQVQQESTKKPSNSIPLDENLKKLFEEWRRQ